MPISQTPSLREIVDFFQGPNDLASYVRGGSYVPNIAANSAISTTVAGLNLAQFKGADKAPSVSVPAGRLLAVNTTGTAFAPAWGSVTFKPDGRVILSSTTIGDQQNGVWITGGSGSGFQIRFTNMTSGLTSNANGTWVTVSSDVHVLSPEITSGIRNYSATAEVRQVGQTAVLATYSISIGLTGEGGGVIN